MYHVKIKELFSPILLTSQVLYAKIVSLVSKRCTCITRACCTDNFFYPYKLDVECSYTFCLYTGFDTLMLSSMKRKKTKIGQRNRFCGKSD